MDFVEKEKGVGSFEISWASNRLCARSPEPNGPVVKISLGLENILSESSKERRYEYSQAPRAI